jgi:hypothetical protein
MKRFLLPASALVLVVTACGAGAKPAPRLTEVGARLTPNVDTLARRREHAAAREAKRLVREFLPPPGARRISEPRSGTGPLGESVDVHRFWSVRQPLEGVIAFSARIAARVRAVGRHLGKPTAALPLNELQLAGRRSVADALRQHHQRARSPAGRVQPLTRRSP